MYDRRSFLKTGTMSVLGGYLLLGQGDIFGQSKKQAGYFAIPDAVYSDKTTAFTRDMFVPHLNSSFTVSSGKHRLGSLRLAEVAERDVKIIRFETANIDSFNLIFAAEGNLTLDDAIYRISHPGLGEFSMFVSTVGRSGSRYQAVFSRKRY
jgi:hypothetical protein